MYKRQEKTGCFAEVTHRQVIGSKMRGIADTGATSQIKSAEALARQEETMTKCKMAAARLDRLKFELSEMEKGVLPSVDRLADLAGLRAVQLLFGHSKIESTVRYPRIAGPNDAISAIWVTASSVD